jgi:hypothetical protein
MTNELINEATPKSTHERLMRHTRHRKVTPRAKSMPGKVTPKKTGNNDPHRGGNPVLHNQIPNNMVESVVKLSKLLVAEESAVPNLLAEEPNRDLLRRIINHMIYVGLGGWHKDGEYYINEHEYRVPTTRWNLSEGGRLVAKETGKPLNCNLDKLHKLKRLIEDGREI